MNADVLIKKIKALKIQGAKNVALAGLEALNIYASEIKSGNKEKFLKELGSKAGVVASSRPTEPALRNSISFIMRRLYRCRDVTEIRKTLSAEIAEFSENIESTIKKIGEIGARRISNGDVVFTHCHSNTVIGIFRRAKLEGKKFSVVCTETRPMNQGLITAKELAKMRIPVTLIVDSAARTFMKKCDMVIIGADAITSTGDVVNKIGSSTMALIAEDLKKPFYVAAGTHKVDPATAQGFLEVIEERPKKEVAKKINGVEIRNPAFDVVAARRITGIITESGVMPPQNVYKLAGKFN